jgi:hypothetical protein
MALIDPNHADCPALSQAVAPAVDDPRTLLAVLMT